jgi:hypothetical protein
MEVHPVCPGSGPAEHRDYLCLGIQVPVSVHPIAFFGACFFSTRASILSDSMAKAGDKPRTRAGSLLLESAPELEA